MSPADRSLALAELLAGTGITLLSLTTGGETLTLRRGGGSARAEPAEFVVAAPCAGVFRRSHPLRDEPLAEPGRPVRAGAVLGLLEIGPLLVEVRAPVGGILRAAEAAEGALVGFGTPLFRLWEGETGSCAST